MFPRYCIILLFAAAFLSMTVYSQPPAIGPGVSHELAKWRAAHYSDVRYNLNLTLEKMSPVLKGTIEIRVYVSEPPASAGGENLVSATTPIILDWRKIKGHEKDSTITNVTINGRNISTTPSAEAASTPPYQGGEFLEADDHLIFRDGVVMGENVIKLDFISPILTSGSAITRYIDKEDGSEYIYSLFVPSDASTAFPVFDQPDLKARFTLNAKVPTSWEVISNSRFNPLDNPTTLLKLPQQYSVDYPFPETKPISTYVFAFAAGPWKKVGERTLLSSRGESREKADANTSTHRVDEDKSVLAPSIYVRRSQAEKFKPHAAEVFRLNREAVKFFEEYFDHKFPFPKYDIVLIPEFPFGGMEHAGATFLKESSVIFPQEPTKNDEISRALLIFHETAHQWFGDTVTMKWFDDLWLKEGFANFMAYKALEKIMPNANAWKIFFERVKQAAYRTDSTKGTTAIYQPIENLSAAKSAYGNIVYNKAPAFLRQAEFYIGEDKFQTAVRAFLKKHEYANATWEDLVKEFEMASVTRLKSWANVWITQRGVPLYSTKVENTKDLVSVEIEQAQTKGEKYWWQRVKVFGLHKKESSDFVYSQDTVLRSPPVGSEFAVLPAFQFWTPDFVFPNYKDYGYGIFLLDDKSREYVLKNIQNEKDPFLRSMMWGALWDSVREGELDPKVYVELVVKVLQKPDREGGRNAQRDADAQTSASEDESTTALLLDRVGTTMNYYMQKPDREGGRNAQRDANALADAQASALEDEAMQKPDRGPGRNAQRDANARADALASATEDESMMQKPDREEGRNAQRNDNALADARASALEDEAMQKPDRGPGRNAQRDANALADARASALEDESMMQKPDREEGRNAQRDDNALADARASALGDESMQKPDREEGRNAQRNENALADARASANDDLRTRVEDMLISGMINAKTQGMRITYYRAFLNIARSDNARNVLKEMLKFSTTPSAETASTPPYQGGELARIPLKTKDKFDIVTRLLILNDPAAEKILAGLEKTETGDDARRYAYAARAGIPTAANKAKYWKDFTENKDISESWIEAALGPWNSMRQSELTLPYLERALRELPNLKRDRKIFFVNGWLGAFIGGQKSEEAMNIVNKFLADNPKLDNDLRLKILENADTIERAVKIRAKY